MHVIPKGLSKRFIKGFSDRKRAASLSGTWLCFGILLLLLRPSAEMSDLPFYEPGQVADRTILAPFTFSISKAKGEIEREQDEAAARVPPVFRRVAENLQRAQMKLRILEDAVSSWRSLPDSSLEPEEMVTPGFTLSAATLALLAQDSTRIEIFQATEDLFPTLFSRHIATRLDMMGSAPHFIILEDDSVETSVAVESLSTGEHVRVDLSHMVRVRHPDHELLARAVYELSAPMVVPTLVLDQVETARRKEESAKAISPIKGKLLAGEIVVEAHTRVTEQDAEELRSLREAYAARAMAGHDVGSFLPVLGHLLWIVLFLGLVAGFLVAMAPTTLRSPSDTALMILVLAIGVAASYGIRWPLEGPAGLVPLAIVAMLATIFFDEGVGFGLTILAFLMAGSHFRFNVAGLVPPLVGAFAAVFRLRQLRKRRDFYLTALWIFAAASLACLPMGLLSSSDLRTLLRMIGYSAVNAAVSSIVVMVALPVLESLFHRATDLRLLELSDMNHVLLRQLALNAPGTYQHSMIVGNLAEAACETIHANALLARVGSYYHDVGKITKPEYFAENQSFNENPHDKLSPKMSALVIASHVKEGLKLAVQEGLPPVIVDFVAQHHGTTSISFFYKKMKEQNPDARIDLEDFSYPGPKPATRETAVVMLADACEGAVRSLQEPTATRIRQVVEKVIHERLIGGQLDQSNLTFRDLEKIRESFLPLLVSVHHHRVKYPEDKKEE